MEWISKSEQETFHKGQALGQRLRGGELITLDGDLGAGKTAFVKGLAAGLGIREMVVSPTFTIVREYKGEKSLAHFDVYRIADPDEMYEIGFDEYLGGGQVCVIEWASQIEDILPAERLRITITRKGDEERRFTVGAGPGYETLAEEFLK